MLFSQTLSIDFDDFTSHSRATGGQRNDGRQLSSCEFSVPSRRCSPYRPTADRAQQNTIRIRKTGTAHLPSYRGGLVRLAGGSERIQYLPARAIARHRSVGAFRQTRDIGTRKSDEA